MSAPISLIREWADHPSKMCVDLWGIIPDRWQDQVFEAFPHRPRIAMKACVGPGKTFVMAALGWNFLLTRPHPRIGMAAVTGDNFRANLRAELSMLRQKAQGGLLEREFEMTAGGEIYHRQHRETWYAQPRTWPKDANPEQIGDTLRGLHAPYVMWLLDEVGAMPKQVLPKLEGIFSGSPTEPHLVIAGNPSSTNGLLYEACVTAKNLWHVVEITGDPDDPNRSPRIGLEWAREQIRTYGRDNPFIMVSILGKFPPAGMFTLIGPDEVREAMKRAYRDWDISDAPKIIAVDVAREMTGDASALCKRQGLQCYNFQRWRGIDSFQGANVVNREWEAFQADACFIDMTGGFGAGWYDALLRLGKNPIGVKYSSDAHAKDRYANKRAEMYFEAVAWIKRGGALPESEGLLQALTQTNYSFEKQGSGDRLILEPKAIVKAKIGYSPDEADAFAQTFAEPVTPARKASRRSAYRSAVTEYNPFSELDRGVPNPYESGYDPFRS